MNCQTLDYMLFKLIYCLKITPREMVVNPFNSHYASSLMFGTRGIFNFKTSDYAKHQTEEKVHYPASAFEALR